MHKKVDLPQNINFGMFKQICDKGFTIYFKLVSKIRNGRK